jgi:hypothetical protein
VRPYLEPAPLAAFFLGISSGAPNAMIAATLTTRLAQYGIRKSAVTLFALTFLAYNFKFLWAPLVDSIRIPLLGRFGQRRSWLWVTGVFVMATVVLLGSLDPQQALTTGRTRRSARRRCRCDVRHRHRRLSHRAARTAPAWRRFGYVAVRLEDRGRRRRVPSRSIVAARYGWAAAYTPVRCLRCPRWPSASAWVSRRGTASRPPARGAIQAVSRISARLPSSSSAKGR